MQIAFAESQTRLNLMRAFAGESQARNRYTFAAEAASQAQLYVIKAVFQLTASQELAHAKVFYDLLKELNGQSVTVDGTYPVEVLTEVLPLLQHAQHNEFQEFDPVYPQFGQIAAQEGFTQAAVAFQQIAKIEKTHGERFGMFAQWMESGKLFVNETPTKWMCLNCGHIVDSTEAPHICPVCSHPQGYFVRQAYAPYTTGVAQA